MDVIIEKINEVFLRLEISEPHIEMEIRERFTFEVENMKFIPQFRKRNWNGEIYLFDKQKENSLRWIVG